MACNLRHILTFVTLLIAVAVNCCLAAEDQLNFQQDDIHLMNFKSSGLTNSEGSEKKYRWEMNGDSADIRHGVYDITTLKLVVMPINDAPKDDAAQSQATTDAKDYDPGEIHVTSPFCQFNQHTSEIRSQERIKITGEGFMAEGIGYDIYLQQDNLIMTIRNAVRITFKNDKFATFELK